MGWHNFTPLPPKAIKKRLFDLGHFFNPMIEEEINEEDLDGMNLSSVPVKLAIQSFQDMMPIEFDRLCNEAYGKRGKTDGIMGVATNKLLQIDRCGEADYHRVSAATEEATGSNSWPAGCHPDWPDNHTILVAVDDRRIPSFWGRVGDSDSVFEQAFELVRQAYAQIGLVMIRVPNTGHYNTIISWETGRGWIGLAIVPGSPPSCQTKIWAKFDIRYRPSDSVLISMLARLLAHELGHNVRLGHSRGGIMNSSIVGGPFTFDEWIGDPSESILNRFFGGVAVDLDDGPDDPDDPPEDDDDPPSEDSGLLSGFLTAGKISLTVKDGIGRIYSP